jgi:hypothetical protein
LPVTLADFQMVEDKMGGLVIVGGEMDDGKVKSVRLK